MQCKKCGKTIPDTAKFCAACGWKVEVIPETPVSVPAEENPEPVKPEQSNLHEEQDTAAQKQTATEQTSGTQEQTMNVQPPVYQNQFEQKASSSQQTPNQKKRLKLR